MIQPARQLAGLVAKFDAMGAGGHGYAPDQVVDPVDRSGSPVDRGVPAGKPGVGQDQQRGVARARVHDDALGVVAADSRDAGRRGARAGGGREAGERLLGGDD